MNKGHSRNVQSYNNRLEQAFSWNIADNEENLTPYMQMEKLRKNTLDITPSFINRDSSQVKIFDYEHINSYSNQMEKRNKICIF
jgi:hypothetical protein